MIDMENYFKKSELLPAIIQEKDTGEVLMLAYMNRESLVTVIQTGAACHTGAHSCFFRELWEEEKK